MALFAPTSNKTFEMVTKLVNNLKKAIFHTSKPEKNQV